MIFSCSHDKTSIWSCQDHEGLAMLSPHPATRTSMPLSSSRARSSTPIASVTMVSIASIGAKQTNELNRTLYRSSHRQKTDSCPPLTLGPAPT
jgi:hypothetical protein